MPLSNGSHQNSHLWSSILSRLWTRGLASDRKRARILGGGHSLHPISRTLGPGPGWPWETCGGPPHAGTARVAGDFEIGHGLRSGRLSYPDPSGRYRSNSHSRLRAREGHSRSARGGRTPAERMNRNLLSAQLRVAGGDCTRAPDLKLQTYLYRQGEHKSPAKTVAHYLYKYALPLATQTHTHLSLIHI